MQITFTQEDVLRHLYGEMRPAESAALKSYLLTDMSLSDYYFETLATMNALPKADMRPRRSILDRILAFSEETAPNHA